MDVRGTNFASSRTMRCSWPLTVWEYLYFRTCDEYHYKTAALCMSSINTTHSFNPVYPIRTGVIWSDQGSFSLTRKMPHSCSLRLRQSEKKKKKIPIHVKNPIKKKDAKKLCLIQLRGYFEEKEAVHRLKGQRRPTV